MTEKSAGNTNFAWFRKIVGYRIGKVQHISADKVIYVEFSPDSGYWYLLQKDLIPAPKNEVLYQEYKLKREN